MAFQLARVNVPTIKYDYPLQEQIALLKERSAMADKNTERYYKAKSLLSELISQIPEEDRNRPEIANEINAIEGGIEHVSGRLVNNEAAYMRGDINRLAGMVANIPNTTFGRYAKINTEYNKRRQDFVDNGGNVGDFDLLNPRENLWNAAKNNTQVTMTTPVDRPDFFKSAVTTVGQITPDVISFEAGVSGGGASTRGYSNAPVNKRFGNTQNSSLLRAINMAEASGKSTADDSVDGAVGPMQITNKFLIDANKLLKKQNPDHIDYTMDDVRNDEKKAIQAADAMLTDYRKRYRREYGEEISDRQLAMAYFGGYGAWNDPELTDGLKTSRKEYANRIERFLADQRTNEFANRAESVRNVTRSQLMQIARMQYSEYFKMFGDQKAVIGEKMGQPIYYGIVVDPETNLPKMKDGEVVYGETFDPEMAVSRPEYEALIASEMALDLHRRHTKTDYVYPKDPAKRGGARSGGRINPNDPEEDDGVNIIPAIESTTSKDEKMSGLTSQGIMLQKNVGRLFTPPTIFSDRYYAEESANLKQQSKTLEAERNKLVALGDNADPRDLIDINRQIAVLRDQEESLEIRHAAIEDSVRDAMDPKEYKLAIGRPVIRDNRPGAVFSKGGYGISTQYSPADNERSVIDENNRQVATYEKARKKYETIRKSVIHDLEKANENGSFNLTDRFTHTQDKEGQNYLADILLNVPEVKLVEDIGFDSDKITSEEVAKRIAGTKINDENIEVRFTNGKTVLLEGSARTDYLKYITQSQSYNMDTRQTAAMHLSSLGKKIADEINQLVKPSSPDMNKMISRVITHNGHKLYIAETDKGRLKFKIDNDEHWSHADYPYHIVQAFEIVTAD